MGSMGSSSSEVSATVGLVAGSSSGATAAVKSMEYSSPEVSGIVKSERVVMLMDGEWVAEVTGDSGMAFGPGVMTDSGGEG